MSKRTLQNAALGIAVVLAVMAPAFANGTGKSTKLSSADKHFILEAAAGGLAEVELGHMAAQKATDSDVKAFGQRMVDDHSEANAKLKQIAAEEGITLPTTLHGEMKATHDKLSKASGAEFDKMYMHDMVMDHQKDVKAFEKEAESGKDADVKKFAADTLPTLREHLKLAESAATKVGNASTKSAKKGGS